MHLVGLAFEVVEKAAHAIPFAVVPLAVGIAFIPGFAFHDPLLVCGIKVIERGRQVEAPAFGVAFEVPLAVRVDGSGEGFYDALSDGEGFVRKGAFEVNADGAAETPALRAGADGIVERKNGR